MFMGRAPDKAAGDMRGTPNARGQQTGAAPTDPGGIPACGAAVMEAGTVSSPGPRKGYSRRSSLSDHP